MAIVEKIKMCLRRCGRSLRGFACAENAAIAIAFAMSMPMFVAAAGVAVDLAQAYNVKTRLGNALDKAGLAAGSSTGEEDDLRERVDRFMTANFPADRPGRVIDTAVVFGDGTVEVSASARVDTIFMRMLGRDYIDVSQSVMVRREMAGVEAVLVLDVTGSMGGARLSALKEAGRSFINIMFSRISDDDYLRIGIVPFSQTVNVGSYGLGRRPDDSYYDTPFMVPRSPDDYVMPVTNIQYGTGVYDWQGCIEERPAPDDTGDVTGPWYMYRSPRGECIQTDWWGNCTRYSNNNNQRPNTGCVQASVVPLTNDRNLLTNTVNALTANGNTYINLGMVWGWRLISPEFPFREGVEYDNPDWTKTVILMTDGDNVPLSSYTGYGMTSMSTAQLNTKLANVCTAMKDAGIRIYTITFQSGISNTTRNLFRNCATDVSKYFDAPNNEDLVKAFELIANELSQLHIVR